MIQSISAIFTAMTTHVSECSVSGSRRDQLSQRLRPSLLSLKQFEQCYILARWIRNLFMDIINQPNRHEVHHPLGHDEQQNHDGRVIEQPSFTPDSPSRNPSLTTTTDPSGPGTTSTDNTYSVGDPPSQNLSTSGDASSNIYDASSYAFSDSPTGTSGVIVGNFVPNFIANEFLPPQRGMSGMNMIDFPSPSSLEYQSLHFLADLGLSGFNNGQ